MLYRSYIQFSQSKAFKGIQKQHNFGCVIIQLPALARSVLCLKLPLGALASAECTGNLQKERTL